MMLRVRLRVPVLLLALLLPLGLVAGCGGDDSKDSSKASSSDLPSQADLKSYFTAVAAYDVDAARGRGEDRRRRLPGAGVRRLPR